MSRPRLILASGSPRRRELLEMVGASFEIITSDCDESFAGTPSPAELVQLLASQKAAAVSALCEGDRIVIGADTVVCDGMKILGKPRDREDAVQTLLALSDREHSVLTGIACHGTIGGRELIRTACVETRVRFEKITRAEAEWYADTGEPMDKAGSYAIQGRGGIFVRELHGDYFNVVGLPLVRLKQMLWDDFGYILTGESRV